MVRDPDFELVHRCQSDDPAVWENAYQELFERYRDRVFNTALRVVGNREDAQDVTQEAFVILFRHIGKFAFESRFFTWFYRIVINLAVDRKKRESGGRVALFSQRATVGDGNEEPSEEQLAVDESELDKRVTDEFLSTRVQSSMDRLSPKLRAIVVARYVDDLSYTEIAEVLECSLGTVKSRLSRAHKALEEFLEPVWKEYDSGQS